MPDYTHDGLLFCVTTPLGVDAVLLEAVRGHEQLSGLFEYHLDLLLPGDLPLPFENLIGQPVTVEIRNDNRSEIIRFIHGIVAGVEEGPGVEGGGKFGMIRYRAEVVPWLWFLGQNRNSRIFQSKSVPDILRAVLTGGEVSWQLQGTYEPRDYCSQYRESDFAFASRLMEEEGIYYFFTHANGKHTLVVADTPESHTTIGTVRYEHVTGGVRGDDRIVSWEKSQSLRPGKVVLWDHCFELPGQNLAATSDSLATVDSGTMTHKIKVGINDSVEVYDYPGAYAQRFDGIAPGGADRAADIQKIFQDNTRTAKLRMQEQAAAAITIRGAGQVRALMAGLAFKLNDHPNADGPYTLTRVEIHAQQSSAFTSGAGEATFGCSFTAIPNAMPFRPARVTPRALVPGTHTATVVGPAGEEIFTDKYGRVKVQLHWDRQGAKDANSSCWVRVGTPWAGQQWGMIHIPRIGQEVIVAFEEGDPDRPMIVGSVYNAAQMPPYTLPDHRTKSGVKSRSSLEGTEEHFNEIRFEDKKDEEEIYIHAERDFNRVVENNDTLKVGFEDKADGNRTVEVFNNEAYTIGAKDCKAGNQDVKVWNDQNVLIGNGQADCKTGDQVVAIWNNQDLFVGAGEGQNADGSQFITIWKTRNAKIKTGDDVLLVAEGASKFTLSKGDQTIEIGSGNRETTLKEGTDTLEIKQGDLIVKLAAGSIKMEAMTAIELKVGSSSIKIEQSGITIKGTLVSIEGTAKADLKSPLTGVTGDGTCKIAGGMVMIG
jgi:type VI secretion system secreted protein VgrG